MTKPKSQKNDASVDNFLAGIKDDQRRTDCLTVLELMKELTGEPAVMWGKSMVGFGRFHYRGKTSEGDWFHVGFASRKQDLTLYLHFSNQTNETVITMSTKQLERRLAKLETEFEQMKADFRCARGQGWRAVVGSHEGSTTFDSVVREMRRLRREEYAKAAGSDAGSQE